MFEIKGDICPNGQTETGGGGRRRKQKTEVEEKDLSGGAEQRFKPAAELSFMGSWM